MDLEKSRDIWVAGLHEALKQNPQELKTLTLCELYTFSLGSYLLHLHPFDLDFTDFHKRTNVVNDIFKTTSVPARQGNLIIGSLIAVAAEYGKKAIREWQRLEEKSARASCKILEETEASSQEKKRRKKKKKRTGPGVSSDDDLCIVCLDDKRSLVYKPCGHRVCCDSCGERLREKCGAVCPWCRADVH